MTSEGKISVEGYEVMAWPKIDSNGRLFGAQIDASFRELMS
jgi:hypothetical protein